MLVCVGPFFALLGPNTTFSDIFSHFSRRALIRCPSHPSAFQQAYTAELLKHWGSHLAHERPLRFFKRWSQQPHLPHGQPKLFSIQRSVFVPGISGTFYLPREYTPQMKFLRADAPLMPYGPFLLITEDEYERLLPFHCPTAVELRISRFLAQKLGCVRALQGSVYIAVNCCQQHAALLLSTTVRLGH
jgi:hypothetical protein